MLYHSSNHTEAMQVHRMNSFNAINLTSLIQLFNILQPNNRVELDACAGGNPKSVYMHNGSYTITVSTYTDASKLAVLLEPFALNPDQIKILPTKINDSDTSLYSSYRNAFEVEVAISEAGLIKLGQTAITQLINQIAEEPSNVNKLKSLIATYFFINNDRPRGEFTDHNCILNARMSAEAIANQVKEVNGTIEIKGDFLFLKELAEIMGITVYKFITHLVDEKNKHTELFQLIMQPEYVEQGINRLIERLKSKYFS